MDMFGNTFFRNHEYKMVTHARIFSLEPKNIIVDDKIGLFLTSQFIHFSKIFNYSRMANFTKIKEMKISLPINENNEIDYEYMKTFIKAIQKIIIKNVADYTQKQLDLTKQVVYNN